MMIWSHVTERAYVVGSTVRNRRLFVPTISMDEGTTTAPTAETPTLTRPASTQFVPLKTSTATAIVALDRLQAGSSVTARSFVMSCALKEKKKA